jgi:hypothetical protein
VSTPDFTGWSFHIADDRRNQAFQLMARNGLQGVASKWMDYRSLEPLRIKASDLVPGAAGWIEVHGTTVHYVSTTKIGTLGPDQDY